MVQEVWIREDLELPEYRIERDMALTGKNL
jgi:hypothetical protein